MKNMLAVLLLSASSMVLANNCPNEMKAIDAKLNAPTGISADKVAKAKSLRAEGEAFHKEGKHDASMKSLQEAKKLLGV